MKSKWSDYRNAVYGYLKHYKHFKGQIANLELEIQGIKDELKSLYDVNLTVNYGEHMPGGYNELSSMERVIVRKQYLETKLSVLIAAALFTALTMRYFSSEIRNGKLFALNTWRGKDGSIYLWKQDTASEDVRILPSVP